MKVQTKVFRSSFSSWATLFEDAAAFATELGRDRLIRSATQPITAKA